jgi:hypothetical protein
MARLVLPKATKRALADELGTTIHTIVNWERGRCIPKQQAHREKIRELCETGLPVSSAKLNVNFLLGGIDANATTLAQPLLTRDKSTTTLVLFALATRIAEHIGAIINNIMFVMSADTVLNTYPSYVNLYVAPVEIPDVRFILRISHIPAGMFYTIELMAYSGEELVSRNVYDVSDSSVMKVVSLLKKFINKLKPNAKRRQKIK